VFGVVEKVGAKDRRGLAAVAPAEKARKIRVKLDFQGILKFGELTGIGIFEGSPISKFQNF